MNNRRIKHISYLFSFGVHALLLLIFAFITYNVEFEEEEFVTVGFGTFAAANSSGKKETKPKEDKKKVEVPKVVNTDKDNEVAPIVENKKEEKKEEKKKEQEKKDEGKENEGAGEGNYGFEIDFGGKGVRKIYSYVLPSYPQGVNKEIDIRLRFSILPDGTVGDVFPLIKADTRLEMAAIRSLKQWRFEPIPSSKKIKAQVAVITFPYRLQ